MMGVLLIEDDARIAQAIAALLCGEGIAVEHVGDGAAGLRRAGDPAIDVIVLDRMLPAMDGMTVLGRMRAAGLQKPVLMLSALGRCDERVEGLDRRCRRLSRQAVRARRAGGTACARCCAGRRR